MPAGFLHSTLLGVVAAPVGADFLVGPLSPLLVAGESVPCPEMIQTASAGISSSQPAASRSFCASLYDPRLP